MTKKIIWTAPSKFFELPLMRIISEDLGSRLSWDFFSSVDKTLPVIDSGDYQGVYIGNLWIPGSKEGINPEYRNLQYGGGLHLIRCSVEKKLPVLVKAIYPIEADYAEKCGAKVIKYSTENAVQRFKEAFFDIA